MLSNSRPSSFSLSTTSTEFTPLDLHIRALPSFGSSSELTGSLERGSKLFRSSSIAVPTVSPDPGNTLETAYNIGTLSDTRTFTDAVSSSDTSDFYRFNLDNTSNFNLSLTGLSSDADVRLIQDVNSNGIVDDGDEIVRSSLSDSQDESINRSLAAGTYFTQVYQYSGDTSYNLNLSATTSQTPSNLLPVEVDFGTLSDTQTYYGDVSGTDTSDVYRFSLNSTSNFNLSLTGLSNDADVRLIQDVNNNGIVDDGDEIVRSAWGDSQDESINHSLVAGTYFTQVYQYSGDTNYNLSLSVGNNPSFTSFSVFDAAGDNTSSNVFEDGAIRLSYNFADTASLSDVSLEVLSGGSVVSTLGTWTGSSLSDALINLADFSSLTGGDYQLRAVAHTTDGQDFFSDSQPLTILSWDDSYGTFAGDTLNYSAGLDTGAVMLGRGGTDTLDLSGVSQSDVTSINGLSLSSFDPLSGSTTNQAIFGGTAFDYLTLSDGREIYFQGIENLSFSDGSTLELAVHPNDTFFDGQWNLHVSDVPSAWRFTQGAADVLLASLDTGILTAAGASGDIVDISTSRLITDPTDDDNRNNPGHGHRAISVMASTANNDSGVAGINWNSDVYVNDVYRGVDLQQAITDTIEYARDNNLRVVFQGGIQGESWLTRGGTQAELEQLIEDNSDIAMFAVAAGNGGPGGNLNDPNYLTSVSGVAKLETTHDNVISVGALRPGTEDNLWFQTDQGVTTVNGLTNATSISLAEYSNRGSNLTLVAATDSPAMDKFGNQIYFGGTSAANPNMAGIASLVWSVNSELTGGELRQILIDTAMDLGTVGDVNTFGNGLVNADAAIRRASALADSFDVANLYSGDSLFV